MVERNKSLFITYVLWLVFGWLGLHHFYLGRDIQAFLWWSTIGGFFGLGWFRDLWRIPEYVDDANESPDFMEDIKKRIRLRKEPPFNVSRFAGQMLVGFFYGILVRLAIPEELSKWAPSLFVPFGVAVGVYMVGNVGRERGDFKWPLLGCYIASIVLTYLTADEPSQMYVALVGAIFFQNKREYKKLEKAKPKSLWKRIQFFVIAGLVVCCLWTCFFYFNAEVTTEDGETIKLRDAIDHFFQSPVWLEFKDVMWQLYEQGQHQGWSNLYDEFVKALDPRGEQNAYRVLGLTQDSTQEEIRRRYKKLAVKWHPDRNPNDKENAQKRFMEIQEAYEVLSTIKSKRAARNTRTRSDYNEQKDHTEL